MLIAQIEAGRTYLMDGGAHVTVLCIVGSMVRIAGHDGIYTGGVRACQLLADVTPEALPPEELLSEKEAAAQIGLSPSVLRNWRTAGISKRYLRQGITLPHVQLGPAVRYRRRNVRQFVEVVSMPRIKATRSPS